MDVLSCASLFLVTSENVALSNAPFLGGRGSRNSGSVCLKHLTCNGYNLLMAEPVIYISDADAVRDFASVLAQVRGGAEVIIEHDAQAVAINLAASDYRSPIF
jgi:hypothetical protein